ncbi:MAG: hypothetical protein BWX55_01767 [Deltaproteobacteria bacterium ADurb.Bin022]|nr:MAG: hypothetical protein BWX55_01767 [Deltaproteobacteria bacterium ADurb.Bin022]
MKARKFVLRHEIIDCIGLITVGHDGCFGKDQYRIVNNQMRIGHFGRVGSLGADAPFNWIKYTVTAVGASAHDEVGNHGFAAGRHPDTNTASRIIVAGQKFI